MAYDVFLSFTRKGHPDLAQRIRLALGKAGLRVFVDDKISEGTSISEEIIGALAQSKVLVVVYSEQYLRRNACQEELRRVFVAAQEEGDPGRRIIVVNPERGNDHIAPAELRDARYVAASGPDADLGGLVRTVRERCASLAGPLSGINRASRPRWLPSRIAGAPGFVGRHGDLWRLHTALRAVDFPLTHATSSGPVALVAGMGGIGKTSLALAYGWHFGAAYPGGVYVTSLTGAEDFDGAVARHADEVRKIARSVRVTVQGADWRQLAVLMGEFLDRQPGPALWIVDDLPPGLDHRILHQLVIPARRVHTIFTSRDAEYRDQAALVPLDGLLPADGAALLTATRGADNPGERDAARGITERLGGHPLALKSVADTLRDKHGLQGYAEYAAALTPGAEALGVIGQSVSRLSQAAWTVAELAEFLGFQALPADLIEMVMSAVTEPNGQPGGTGQALDRLISLGLARRDGTWWHIHPLVIDAVRQTGSVPAANPALAFAAARAIRQLGESAQASGDVVGLARTLVASPVLQDTSEADLLLELMAGYYESVGDVIEAARTHRLLARSQPGSPSALTAAALASNASKDYADAERLARDALGHGRTFPALWALADAQDGLGRYAEAAGLWSELDAADMPLSARGTQRIAYEVARARAHLARGQLKEATDRLRAISESYAVDDADGVTAHQANLATVQLAVLGLYTGREREARQLTGSVVSYYRKRNAERHATCLEAELAWAEAAVSTPLLELRVDKGSWAEAVKRLRELYGFYEKSAGADSVLTLSIAVQLALILVRIGAHNREAIAIVTKILPVIENQLGNEHPLWLRSQYVLGLAHAYQNEFEAARPLLEAAWAGQKQVLGPRHPETLITQVELACVLLIFDPERGRSLNWEVLRAIPGVAGWKTFIYGRAFFAATLLPAMPSLAVRGMWKFTNVLGRKDPDSWWRRQLTPRLLPGMSLALASSPDAVPRGAAMLT
jgi:tetratricopeptide (TPR) repeat protein